MKQKIQLIFASFLLVSTSVLFCACDGEDWWADRYSILTDASHGSLKNGQVVATGKVQNVTQNSATILCSANYNYKESLQIRPGILYGDNYNGRDIDFLEDNERTTHVEISDFTTFAYKVTLNNLRPSTTYYYCAYAKTSGNNYAFGEIKSFTTAMSNTPGEAVDLGLSVKWASLNIGAAQPEQMGAQFYWGGTTACQESSNKADWHDFSISTLKNQGYIDNDNNLCPLHDAATQMWGSGWRMPTEDECRELVNKCSWKKTTKNGNDVFLVTGPNGNVIYLPCYYYWSSTASSYSSSYSYYLRCEKNSSVTIIYDGNRSVCRCIRPVLK